MPSPAENFRKSVEADMLKGTKNPEMLRPLSRLIFQEHMAMELDAVTHGKTTHNDIWYRVPDSNWFVAEADQQRQRLLTVAAGKGIEGTHDQRIARVLKDPVTVPVNPADAFMRKKFTDLGYKPEWELSPVAIHNPEKPKDELVLNPMELLDLMKLTRMEKVLAYMEDNKKLLPHRVGVGQDVNQFLDAVIEEAKKPKNKKTMTAIYAERKLELIKRLEEKSKGKEMYPTEKIDYDQYKTDSGEYKKGKDIIKFAMSSMPSDDPDDLRKALEAGTALTLNDAHPTGLSNDLISSLRDKGFTPT